MTSSYRAEYRQKVITIFYQIKYLLVVGEIVWCLVNTTHRREISNMRTAIQAAVFSLDISLVV